MEKVEVKRSKIRGRGVYAIKDIKKGQEILIIDDSHVVKDQSKLTGYQREHHCDYLSNGKIVLMQPPEVYINHSCDPTTYVKTIKGVRRVIAMRDIKKGEEITYDYSINGNDEGTFKCKCGSKNCRGVYQGNFFKLPKDLQVKYLPYLDDWFVKEHKDKIEKLKK